MTDPKQEPTPKTKAARKRGFPIRQFAKLFDQFTEDAEVADSQSVGNLRAEINDALLAHYKQ